MVLVVDISGVVVTILSVMLVPSDVAVPLRDLALSVGNFEALMVEVSSFLTTFVAAAEGDSASFVKYKSLLPGGLLMLCNPASFSAADLDCFTDFG